MRKLMLPWLFICWHLSSFSQIPVVMQQKEFTMLCLGDSYTIGEGVEEAERFPNQCVMQLHLKGIFVDKPKIIATTGWTTDELMSAIQKENIHLLIDVIDKSHDHNIGLIHSTDSYEEMSKLNKIHEDRENNGI